MKRTSFARETEGIAIVGLAGRFPGAADVAEFWRNLCAGVESVSRFTTAELEDDFSDDVRRGGDFVAARSVLEDSDLFDAPFFGMHAREADLTDPQHRVLLECAWTALEDAGYDPKTYAGAIGVVAGCSISSYFLRNVLGDTPAIARFTSDYQVGSYPELLGSGHDFVATRIAYKLNLRGPAMTVQSACSTSLLAVAQAAQALMLGQADIMLAGAASITYPQKRGVVHQDGGMVAADGHCRSFDVHSSGTVFGSGAGVVVLKRLEDARADGDTVYAVIRGFGVNNDGSAKIGYTAPSAAGQAAAISAAHAMAGFAPETIAYVECHGTATPLGDPIEIAALTKAFAGATEPASCALGSVKTNVGHLDVAAGMSGLIKTALAIHHGRIPATLHFTAPNPHIDFSSGPFYVNTELAAWRDERRRAGVSAFGLGGTNVHLALEAAPTADTVAHAASDEARPHLLVLSARSEAALGAAASRLEAHLREATPVDLGDVAYTLQIGRHAFAHRLALTATTASEAATKLADPARRDLAVGQAAGDQRVAFMFPGQGAQYPGMGRDLYAREPVFARAIDRCAEALRPSLATDLTTLLFADDTPEARTTLTATENAQPAIFAVEYALARLWLARGIVPDAMIGHSVGEFVAATLAGVMSLEDAIGVVAERGRLMASMQPGAMLAVRLPAADLATLLDPTCDIAAINGPALTVAAGPFEAIAALEDVLAARSAEHRRIETSHAFHSSMMDGAVAPLLGRLRTIAYDVPRIPYVSTVTGDWIDDAEATSPDYWARHCRATVAFSPGIETLAADEFRTYVEVGPGTALGTFVRQTLGKNADARVVASLATAGGEPETAFALASLGRLWAHGATPDWSTLHARAERRRVSLPTYPFERKSHWVEPVPAAPAPAPIPLALPETEPVDMNVSAAPDRRPRILRDLSTLLEELSGESVGAGESGVSFLELGFDSLFLGRFAQQVANRFGFAVTFRQLLGEYPSLDALTDFALSVMPAEAEPVAAPSAASALPVPAAPAPAFSGAPASAVESLMRDQLAAMQQLMRDQLAALGSVVPAPAASAAPVAPVAVTAHPPATPATAAPAATVDATPSRFDVYRAGNAAAGTAMTDAQRAHIDALIERTVARTRKSKEQTQRYRHVLADPRAAAGFRAEWKEMVYPITCVRAHGSRIWDLDGNEYIDVLNGFGQTAFGHAPDFVVDAVTEQLQAGFAIGPQSNVAGEVAELFCEITGNERATFCNTGSEAVMAALRVARTVTGRDRVVVFNGAYHGQFDEVLVKGARTSERSLPVAPGIPNDAVANVRVLEYGSDASLAWIREHANELAAVVVEPVQSRHPGFAPVEFLREVRAITEASQTALVFDEVVTGFRIHPGGMQHVFDIRADLATYGKVVGGGLPIGILAGTKRFMDALDGGMWQYGDDSFPEVAPTFFAGTFVRHPLVMAAVRAVLLRVKERGAALQGAISERTERLVDRLNASLAERDLVSRIERCGSLFYISLSGEEKLASLLYYHMRERGIYVQEGFPCFLTTEHTDADVDRIVTAFEESLDALRAVGIFGQTDVPNVATSMPPTEQQTEIWLAAQLGDEASCAFNESITLRLRGTLDERAFARAWNKLVDRHESLRATFDATGETMHVAASGTLEYDVTDMSAMPSADAEASFADLLASDARTPFDLVAGPVARGRLVRLAPDEHAFIFTAHHIVCDGWSINVLLDEFATIYTALASGTRADLPVPLAFSTYARMQRERTPEARAKVETYWLERFAEPVAPLDIPTDRPRAALKTFAGATRSTSIDAARYTAIKKAGAKSGCTLFATLLGAFSALAGRLADRRDVVVAIPAAGQSLVEDQVLVGHCVDFLPIRHTWQPGDRLADMLAAMKRHVLDANEHQDYTLGTLVRTLAPTRASNRLPLTELQFNLERLADGLALPGLDIRVEPNPKAFVNFDLFLNVIESSDGLRLDCDYNTDLFDAETIDRWLTYYGVVLDAIVADANQTVDHVSYMPAAERAEVLAGPNATRRAYPSDATIHALFEARAAARPSAIAATCGGESISYAELDRRANRLAHLVLTQVRMPNARVGVAVERSIDLLVALLAVLKAGASYVPLDLANRDARLTYMVEDAGLAAVIVDGDRGRSFVPNAIPLVSPAPGAAYEQPSTAPAVARTAADAAYTIYTSGSTGKPKGVEVTHRSVVNFLCSMANEPGLRESDVLVAVTTVAFDIAGLELYLPLIVGATVAIADRDECTDGFRLLERIKTAQATALQATPATWRMLLEAGFRCPAGFTMLCGGEALPRDLANRLLAGEGTLWNMYGPTETTIWSTCVAVTAGDEPITVGRPIANTRCYVLDSNDEPVPVGCVGQLHIAGDGVANGYVNRPDLTAEKFVADPFGPGRMYRTGDFARLLPSGEFAVLGRMDHQIKLRGFRIELGEIEAVLASKTDLAASAVALREDTPGSPRLVGYYVERAGAPDVATSTLATTLAAELPDYMIPSLWVRLDALPLNGNGKLDRSALPAPAVASGTNENFTAPETAMEVVLGKIWSDVLRLDRISVTDDLFALGADSINLFQITARANREGVPLVAKQLLANRTIRELGRCMEAAAVESAAHHPLDARSSRLKSLHDRIHSNV
jgi:amino acid adenylation domain-containing protein